MVDVVATPPYPAPLDVHRRGRHRSNEGDVTLTFSGTQAADVVGISYRQLDYWARTDLVRPSIVDAKGSGSRRHYSYRDLLELRMVKSLLDAGLRLESVREVFDYVRRHVDDDITSAHLVIDGSSVVLCRGDELIDVVRRGQGVLNLLPIAHVKEQVDGQIVALFPEKVEPERRAV